MNQKFKGMFKWMDTFYGKDFTNEQFYLGTDKFEYYDFDDYDHDGNFVPGIKIPSYKIIYNKLNKHLDVHHDLWVDLEEYFNVPSSECKIVFKVWFGNKFDVDIDQVNYWQTT